MKLLVFSDSHGMPLYMRETLEKHRDVDAVIFLGDGQNDFQMMRALFPKIFCTHGHLYHVKSGLYTVVCAAREAGANLLLFGHTHEALETYDDGLYILNPGSCSGFRATCGLVDISPAGILTNILHIN